MSQKCSKYFFNANSLLTKVEVANHTSIRLVLKKMQLYTSSAYYTIQYYSYFEFRHPVCIGLVVHVATGRDGPAQRRIITPRKDNI